MKTEFRKELTKLINRESMENASDTPDFILAEYLTDCLDAFDRATKSREKWYGRERQPLSVDEGFAPQTHKEMIMPEEMRKEMEHHELLYGGKGQ